MSGNPDAGFVERVHANPWILAWLFKPIQGTALGPAIAVATGRFQALQSLHTETAALRQALQDRKAVEKAKGMVMKYTGLGEDEAYRRLRKFASAQDQDLVEGARVVIAAGELFRQMEHPLQRATSVAITDRSRP